MVSRCTNLWLVVGYRRDFCFIQVEIGGFNLKWLLALNPIFQTRCVLMKATLPSVSESTPFSKL